MFAVFDTEGTRYTDSDGEAFAVLYNWDFLAIKKNTNAADITKENVDSLTKRNEGRDCASLYGFLSSLLHHAVTVKIAVHNLSYDYAYLREWLRLVEDAGYIVQVVARSSTNILKISISQQQDKYIVEKVVFFDTLAIFAKSLRNLGESLGYFKDFIDYYEDLAPDSMLSLENVDYNHRDTDLLMVAICTSLLKQPGVTMDRLGSQILTKTGIVRVLDRTDKHMGGMVVGTRETEQGPKPLTVYDMDRQFVAEHQIDSLDLLKTWDSYGNTQNGQPGCYAGGVNLSNTHYLGVVSHGVMSYDLKSAYPAIMLSMSVPVNPHIITNPADFGSLLEPRTPKIAKVLEGVEPFWVGTVIFHDVKIRGDWLRHVGDVSITEAMVTQHRKTNEGVKFADGHLFSANVIAFTFCNPTFYEFCEQFTFSSAEFESLTIYDGYELPTPYMVLRVLHHYKEKTAAKSIGKACLAGTLKTQDIDAALSAGLISVDEADRLKQGPDERWVKTFIQGHKGNLNSLYGVLVTAPLRDEFDLNVNQWLFKVDMTDEEKWAEYCDGKVDGLMWREAGVMVALLNRYKIVAMIHAIIDAGADVLYTDTDSIKILGITKEQADAIFAPIHSEIETRTRYVVSEVLGRLNAQIKEGGTGTPEVTLPDDPDFRALGKLDYEGTYERFVSMGHKKYAINHPAKVWDFACSGYKLSILDKVCRAMLRAGIPQDMVPLYVLGYDVRYDSLTGIASLQITTDDTWRTVSMDAQDKSGDTVHRHIYTGQTCPGFAIFDAGKIMNHTASLMNGDRFRAAVRNNPLIKAAYRTDISCDKSGAIIWGPRGTVPMAWKDWDVADSAWDESAIY